MVTTNGHTGLKEAQDNSIQGRAEANHLVSGSDVGSPLQAFYFPIMGVGAAADAIPDWNPLYPNLRDKQLQRFAQSETMMAAAKHSLTSRMQTLNYTVNGPDSAKEKAQKLLDAPGFGDSFDMFVGKLSEDLLTADNGGFIEKFGPGRPDGPLAFNQVTGFGHLDSRQCWRTFDPDYPVIYTNPYTNKKHRLHYSRVIMLSDNPVSSEIARNIGFCAVSRALTWARIARDMTTYKGEKISGRFTRALGVISGVTQRQFSEAMEANDETGYGKGWVIYKGIPFLVAPGLEAGEKIDIALQDLASIPDGFDAEREMTMYAYILAWAFGVDAREFWPATASGATRADAEVQNIKAQRRGIGSLTQLIEWGIRQCLPESVKFEFDVTDESQEKAQEEVKRAKLQNWSLMVQRGALNGLQMQALALAAGIVDADVLENLDIPATSDTATAANPSDAMPDQTPEQPPSTTPQQQPVDGAGGQTKQTSIVKKKASNFADQLTNIVTGIYKGTLNSVSGILAINTVINTHFKQAWEGGMAKFGLSLEDMTPEENVRLQHEIGVQAQYIGNYVYDIRQAADNGKPLSSVLYRVALWENAYYSIYNIAASMAAADQPAYWKLGQTEDHCGTCLHYSQQGVHRMSIWRKYLVPVGHMPRQIDGGNKECGGWRCDCDLEPTDEKIKPGKIAVWQG